MERREFIKYGGILGVAGAGGILIGLSLLPRGETPLGVSGSRKDPMLAGSVPTPNISIWPEITIPVDMPFGDAFTINNVEYYHFPRIGLRNLYFIFNREDYPLLGICCIWDPNMVKTGQRDGNYLSRYRLGGDMYFQDIFDDPFTPDINNANRSSIDGRQMPHEKFIQFSFKTINKVLPEIEGRPYSLFVKQRPLTDKALAIVLGDEIVEYNGEPSPLSFITAKFKFDTLPGDFPDLPGIRQT